MSKLILVVEDDVANRNAIAMAVEFMLGYKIITAKDGREGVRLAQENQPDLILMDLSMPEVDGWQATKMIKRIDALKDIPIIAISAHALSGDREKALQAGCDDYLPKPIDIDVLVALVEKYVPTSARERARPSEKDSRKS